MSAKPLLGSVTIVSSLADTHVYSIIIKIQNILHISFRQNHFNAKKESMHMELRLLT